MNPLRCFLAGLLSCGMTLAQAGFSIGGTRVIYHEAEGEASVHLKRVTGDKPVLLQVWLDDGDPAAKPGTQNLPFIVTPAVSRVNANGTQVIRILHNGDALPQDRETLLFFNALEIPAARDTDLPTDKNYLQLATQARMKFFYRPASLPIAATQAPDLLRFELDASSETANDTPFRLRIHNPTPYYVTIRDLALHAPDADAALAQLVQNAVAPMVAPYGDLTVPLQALTAANAAKSAATTSATAQALPLLPENAQVHYRIINDQGGLNTRQGVLSHAS